LFISDPNQIPPLDVGIIGAVAKIHSQIFCNPSPTFAPILVDFTAQKRRNQVSAIPKIIRISHEKLINATSALIFIIHKRLNSCQPDHTGESSIHVASLNAYLYCCSFACSTIQLAGRDSFMADKKISEIPTAKATSTGAKRSFIISPTSKKSIFPPISPNIPLNTSFSTKNGDIAIATQSTITLHSRTTTNAASGKTSRIANQTFKASIRNF
jgi:hypothetical protein